VQLTRNCVNVVRPAKNVP